MLCTETTITVNLLSTPAAVHTYDKDGFDLANARVKSEPLANWLTCYFQICIGPRIEQR